MSHILAAGAARMKLEAENYEARIAALEAQLAAHTGGVKPLDEDDYEEIISAAAINMRKATSGIRGQVITVQDSLDWWVMKETEHRILSVLTRTGAVKVKALVWDEITQARNDADPTHEVVGWEADAGFSSYYTVELTGGGASMTDPDYAESHHDHPNAAKTAAQADYERRILSALEPHPRAKNTVDAHETANVSDKPATPELNIRELIADIEAGRADGFLNDGSDPHGNDLNCTHCGGSGHIDDVHPTPPEGQQEPVANEPVTHHWPEAYEVADILAENKGFWRACSGCHESNEGHPTGPWSIILGCNLGHGCHECGGIGAIWDTTDYADMGDYLAQEFTRPSEQAVTEAAGPFVTFAKHAVEKTDDGWVWRTSSNERICDWFGPSDFGALKAAMEAG